MSTEQPDSGHEEYARRLSELQGAWWKRLLPVQAPYRWNLRRLDLGYFLDVGCGVGRNLRNLDGNGIGVDTNAAVVQLCREQGLDVYEVDEFLASSHAIDGHYDAMLVAHVLEHMPRTDSVELLRSYRRFVRPGGRVVAICPQERGYASDATHVEFLDIGDMEEVARESGLDVLRTYSFPFPRWMGRAFVYNESIVVAAVPQ